MERRRNGRLDRFEDAQLLTELRELHPALPSSESEELADCAQLADLLDQLADNCRQTGFRTPLWSGNPP